MTLIGKVLAGRYEIIEEIGSGGMAVVYKAYDNIDDRIVAIKILKDEFLSNEEFKKRFKNESKAIAVLSHPNIVRVYNVSFGDRIQYIVMEYIDGITLKEYLDDTKKDFDESAKIHKCAPKWVGELYLEFHRGTYTSIAEIKRNNRKSEFLMQKAEALSYIDSVFGGEKADRVIMYNPDAIAQWIYEKYPHMQPEDANKIYKHELAFTATQARYVKIKALTEHSMPEWHGAKGYAAFLFIDEIAID